MSGYEGKTVQLDPNDRTDYHNPNFEIVFKQEPLPTPTPKPIPPLPKKKRLKLTWQFWMGVLWIGLALLYISLNTNLSLLTAGLYLIASSIWFWQWLYFGQKN